MNKSNQLIVHKFGGTSLANAERFRALKTLLTGPQEVIVVSAVQGTTSLLQTLLDSAKAGKAFTKPLEQLEQEHETLAGELLSGSKLEEVTKFLHKDLSEIKDLLHAVQLAGSYSKEVQDLVLGYGELWSAKILALHLGKTGRALFLDASTALYAFEKNGLVCIDWQKSEAALKAFLKGKDFDQLIITGYIASTLEGKRSTLGRNGSDFSAAIFANLFEAKELCIWTDVDGIYSADPQRVRSAFVIANLSYKEALELAYFGAKVLHPQTIGPAMEKQIPIYIKNSLNPAAPGSCISAASPKSAHPVRGLSCIDQVALINIEGSGMAGVSGIAARVFDILQAEKISVILISQASSEHSICFAVAASLADKAIKTLNEYLQFEVEKQQIEKISLLKDCAILAVVGDGMVGAIGVSGRLFGSLAKANINIRAISQGSSERNISVVISNEDINKALQIVHASFYLSPKTISIGLVGPGAIGGTLLDQINGALDPLKSKYEVNLCVRGLMNSKQMVLSHEPLPLKNWRAALHQSPLKADLQAFCEHILADDIPHAVLIDCTANQGIASRYLDFMKAGLHVITPNKHANAGDLGYYKKLKAMTHKKDRFYLYEATVCAGLPVINTLQDLIKTGDEVVKIEGIVSGTLSYIFSELAKGEKRFSELVLEAKELGYTEPDPREDLSGMDVARKLVCLAREAGHMVSLDAVKVHNLVPEVLRDCSLAEFLKNLPAHDQEMEAMVAKARAQKEKLAYVGSIQDGKVEIAIKAFPESHPFARMRSTDNMLLFHTKRYQDLPLVIEGPGAGAEVTAAGIFADLLRLVSFIS